MQMINYILYTKNIIVFKIYINKIISHREKFFNYILEIIIYDNKKVIGYIKIMYFTYSKKCSIMQITSEGR